MSTNKFKFLRKKPWASITIVFLLAAIGVCTLFLFQKKETHKSKVQSGQVQNQSEWAQRIDAVGPQKAYEEFKAANLNNDFGEQHLAVHIFGKFLYDKTGIEGITVCDSSFAFGCYHGFMGRAISIEGLDVVNDINKKCIEMYGVLGTGCQHGIGHGILEYSGYNNLEKALDSCSATTQVNPLFGCTSGVFMEYNTPLIISDTSAKFTPRAFINTDPYNPCTNLEKEPFRLSCYYELGEWWASTHTYAEMGSLCAALKNPQESEVCLEGIGRIAAESTHYDVSEIGQKCKTMSSSGDAALCSAGASWSVYADPAARSKAGVICSALPKNEQGHCKEKNNLICNYITDATIQQSCYRDIKISPMDSR